MRKTLILALLASATLTSGCNTIHGAGKDVASVGNAVARTANEAK